MAGQHPDPVTESPVPARTPRRQEREFRLLRSYLVYNEIPHSLGQKVTRDLAPERWSFFFGTRKKGDSKVTRFGSSIFVADVCWCYFIHLTRSSCQQFGATDLDSENFWKIHDLHSTATNYTNSNQVQTSKNVAISTRCRHLHSDSQTFPRISAASIQPSNASKVCWCPCAIARSLVDVNG